MMPDSLKKKTLHILKFFSQGGAPRYCKPIGFVRDFVIHEWNQVNYCTSLFCHAHCDHGKVHFLNILTENSLSFSVVRHFHNVPIAKFKSRPHLLHVELMVYSIEINVNEDMGSSNNPT